ncbi:MAG: SPASM domain-containing protein [Sphingomonas sp.]
MRRPIPLFRKLIVELQANCNRECFFCNREFDQSGKRYDSRGRKVLKRMPSEQAISILDQARDMGFRGHVAFHHYSEPFLDDRIIEMAQAARARGMLPYEHTNGDVLRRNDALCRAAVEVFDYLVVGLYDYTSDAELEQEIAFWRDRLRGIRHLRFSLGGQVFPRTLTPHDARMFREKKSYPDGPCHRPAVRLILHYDGEMALCCEDMQDRFELGNAFETPIEQLWYGEKHVRIMKALQKGRREQFALCAGCPIPPPEPVPLAARIRRPAQRAIAFARRAVA